MQKITDRVSYYDAFESCHIRHDLSSMEELFAGYANARPDTYLKILQE